MIFKVKFKLLNKNKMRGTKCVEQNAWNKFKLLSNKMRGTREITTQKQKVEVIQKVGVRSV